MNQEWKVGVFINSFFYIHLAIYLAFGSDLVQNHTNGAINLTRTLLVNFCCSTLLTIITPKTLLLHVFNDFNNDFELYVAVFLPDINITK